MNIGLNLAWRWYLGYDLDERLPDHSSLTRMRERFGLEIFQRFFEQIVQLCIDAGLVWGKEVYIDATKVEANADIQSMLPRFIFEAQQHSQSLFAEAVAEDANVQVSPGASPHSPRGLVDKYEKKAQETNPRSDYEKRSSWWLNPIDPSASPMCRFNGDRAILGYHRHYLVDGGRERIILAVLVTAASIMENMPMTDLIFGACLRWGIHPDFAVGDTTYGTSANIVALENNHIRAYVPITDWSKRTGFYGYDAFVYYP